MSQNNMQTVPDALMKAEAELKRLKGKEFYRLRDKSDLFKLEVDNLYKKFFQDEEVSYHHTKLVNGEVIIRPKATEESYDSLIRLIKEILRPESIDLNQSQIIRKVRDDGFSMVRKTWSTPLPRGAVNYIKTCFENDKKYGLSECVAFDGMSLRDLHQIVKNNFKQSNCKSYRAKIIIDDNSVTINGVQFNFGLGGKDKSIVQVRISRNKLLKALDSKSLIRKFSKKAKKNA